MTATDIQPFLLDYFAVNGRLVERLPDTERGIDLHEWTTWLRVRSNAILVAPRPPADDDATGFVPPAFLDDGLAVLVVVRSHHDLEGRSIGVFHDRLPADEVELLRRAVELTPWPELPRPAGGHVAAPELRIEYSSGSTLIRRAYNARSGNFRAAIQPLEQIINGHLSRLLNRPAGTLALEVDAEHPDKNNPKDFTLRVNFVNKGSGPIALTDPRILPPNADPIAAANRFFDGVHPRLELHVGELESEIPDAWPPRWTALPPNDLVGHARWGAANTHVGVTKQLRAVGAMACPEARSLPCACSLAGLRRPPRSGQRTAAVHASANARPLHTEWTLSCTGGGVCISSNRSACRLDT